MTKYIILFLFLSSLLSACETDFSERIQTEINKKIAKFEREQKAQCRKELLKKATHIVDSTLLAQALAAGVDTSTVSNRIRPEKPEAIVTYDSLEVKPIFESER